MRLGPTIVDIIKKIKMVFNGDQTGDLPLAKEPLSTEVSFQFDNDVPCWIIELTL